MQKRQATKTIASPVFADCRRVGIETAGEVGREPFPSRRPGSMTARRSLASRQASEPEIILRDVPRPPHVGTSYSNPWSMPGPQKLCVARAVFCFRFQLSHMVYSILQVISGLISFCDCTPACRRVCPLEIARPAARSSPNFLPAVQWRGAGWVECGECGRRAPALVRPPSTRGRSCSPSASRRSTPLA